jgi:hypothetical protein
MMLLRKLSLRLKNVNCLINCKILELYPKSLTRACSGWPQHSGGDSTILATADAQAVIPLKLSVGQDREFICECQEIDILN